MATFKDRLYVKATPQPHPIEKLNSMSNETFFVSTLPDIPEPCEKLKKLLSGYQETSQKRRFYTKKVTKKKKLKKQSLNNGFMAFRSYYSKHISKFNIQTSLSRHLADLWKEEKHQHVWQRYAEEYNRSKTNLLFVRWLEESTGNLPQADEIDHTFKQVYVASNTIVEDVYSFQ
ncbi:unnamed protein product [Ambrosiozyma monospora]|uniref:Unnamed protein product n=1 Tax=Ambrosiozyma monospora TaxID=43982 RepID=A0ACB5U022_AMBMO|nr:unnamed protein product [Ambrosiozyma monospora]